jgi:serine protease AprX
MKTTVGAKAAWLAVLLTLMLYAAASGAGISEPLARWMRVAAPQDRAAVWVFFTDRGQRTPADLERDIVEAAARFTTAAVERRLMARPSRPFDERDLPLHRPYVEAVGREGVEFRAFSKWLNAASVWATASQVDRLARLEFVDRLSLVSGRRGGLEPLPARGPGAEVLAAGDYGPSASQLYLIQVPMLHDEGFTGAGVKVAVFDTGFWLDHEVFSDLNVIAEWDFINDDPVTENQPGDPDNQHYHGTMCLSIIGGHALGTLVGPAYNAEYILAKTEDMSQEAPVEEDWWIEAAEWADSLGARVISSSLCYNDWYTYEDMDGNTAPITIAADMAVANGIVVANAAGNSGSSDWKYILAPADGFDVLTVGSVDSTGQRSYWSSQGPTYDGRIKPTVMAMGEDTYIADPVAGATSYRRGNGTSFATPLVAGAVALMLEKNPLWGPPEVTEAILNTSTRASSPDTLYGYGILRAHAASQYPEAGVAPVPALARLKVYPNPASSELLLSHPPGPGRARIFDVSGRLVGEVRLSPGGLTRIDMDGLAGGPARGVYFIDAGDAGVCKVLILK